MKKYKLTAERITPSGTEIPPKQETVLEATGEFDILSDVFDALNRSPYRIRLTEIEYQHESHKLISFKRSIHDNKFVTG